jgi:hypothetical protein
MNKILWLAGLVVTFVFLILPVKTYSQIVEVGFKAGASAAWVRYDDPSFRKTVKVSPVPGYSLGPVVSFKVRDRYFLHTEYLFSTKGRKNTGKIVPLLEDKVTYYYLEVPVLYNVFFKGHLKLRKDKQFKYYAGAGPIFSYWLGGRGKIFNDEFEDNQKGEQKYRVLFGTRDPEFQTPDEVYIEDAKRLQVGFAIGGGILTEPDAKRRIMVDVRFEYGHSWLSKNPRAFEDFYFPVRYSSNEYTDPPLKARNMSARISAIYLFELDSNKKARNKGKSNLKKKLNNKR